MMRRIAAIVLGVSVLLSGCAAEPEDPYAGATAESLQSGVLAVTEASAAGDPAAALARLDELQAALLDANAKGTVEQSRFDSISAAIALVRADLEKAIAAQVEVVVPDISEEDTTPGNSGKSDKDNKPDKDDKDD